SRGRDCRPGAWIEWVRLRSALLSTSLSGSPFPPARKLAVSHTGHSVGRMRDGLLENLLVLPHCSCLNCTRNRDPYPPVGEKAVAGIESPRPKGYAWNVEPCWSGLKPPG